MFDVLGGKGEVLVVVDQPSSIGSLPIAVARSMGIDVAYLPGLSMRRLNRPRFFAASMRVAVLG